MANPRRSDLRPVRTPRHRGVCRAGVLLLATAVLATFPQAAVQAHTTSVTRTIRVYAGTIWNGSFCVFGRGLQRHYESHITTYTESPNCGYYPQQLPPYTIRHRAEWYKSQPWLGGPYSRCHWTGEYTNRYRVSGFTTWINYDVWHYCNWGAGVHVDITMDTWNWAHDGGAWRPYYGGGAVRPITWHCHCP